jgi:hypothetical protein
MRARPKAVAVRAFPPGAAPTEQLTVFVDPRATVLTFACTPTDVDIVPNVAVTESFELALYS